ncbi:hypothetical protein GGS26DRAFT_594326 [Hypomontagnella submonticulosa]|nr:hypothetical protein GGS26DRAFT_594326 [Hypomontagnella submonticulosa]
MRTQTLFLLVAPAVMATTPRARQGLPKSFAQTKLTNTLATCGKGYTRCENGCMPIGDVCCNDNTDEYCLEGYYCVPNACCPVGKVCSGSSNDDASCAIGEIPCGDLCMPIDGTCCSDGKHYCPDFGTCTSDGYCCDLGDDCEGSSGSSVTGFSSGSGSTSTSSRTTTSRTTTKTTTSTLDFDDETTSTPKTRTTSSSSTSSSSSTTVESNINAPVTPTTTAITTTILKQAGGIFTADGRIAAGLAAVAALLV